MRLMALPPSLSEQPALLIADASVVINLNATGCAEEILKALSHRVAVVDVVVDEINGGVRKGRQDASKLAALIAANVVEVVRLGPQGLLRFESLVVGSAGETLDDGEAATIAYAEEAGARALIDERKARRLACERHAAIPLGCTADLLASVEVKRALGAAAVAEAVHNALIGSHMRVLEMHMDWVVQLIGDERAVVCLSLPESTRRQARARLLASSAVPPVD
jgi:predicted nucleic acid-binding protein